MMKEKDKKRGVILGYLPIKQLEFVPHFCFHYQNFNKKNQFPNKRITDFYEIDFITKGTALLTIDGIAYFFEQGDICFRKPGQLNKYSWNHRYECDTLHFEIKSSAGKDFETIFDTFPTFLQPKDLDEIYRLFQELKKAFSSTVEYEQLNAKILAHQLLLQVYSAASNPNESKPSYHPAIRHAISYIQNNLSEELNVQILAQKCNLSPSYFQLAFKNSTGKTPNQFVMEQRLNQARKLLLSTDFSIGDIGFECGFSSSSYFIYVFKKMYRQTPFQFRQTFGTITNH